MSGDGIMIRYFDYDRNLLSNSFLRDLEEDVSNIDTAISKTGYTIGYPGWNLLYYCLFCSLDRDNENVIIETGTNWGFSTIVMAQALIDSKLKGHIYSVELEKANYEKALEHLKKAGVSHLVTLENASSHDYLMRLVPTLTKPVRFVFLDSSHLQDDCFREFELIYQCLIDESIVFFDNTYKLCDANGREQRVNGALRMIVKKYGGNLVNFPNTSWYTPGQAIWQRAPFKKDWNDLFDP